MYSSSINSKHSYKGISKKKFKGQEIMVFYETTMNHPKLTPTALKNWPIS